MATDVPPNYIGGNTDGTDYVGDIVNNVSGSYYEIVGGNQRSNAATGNVEGNITLNLDNIDVSYSNGFICGGNLLNYLDKPYDHKETMGYVSGKVTINFNSGTLSAGQGLYGGNAGGIPYQTNNWVGSVEMNLNGGNVIGPDAYVAGSGSAYANVKGDVAINLNAGEISEIIGVNGGGKVLINATGGTVGTIYAGGQGASSVVLGSTNIVLGGNVNVTGDVYGGGWYGNDLIKSQIKNGTNITISGNASVGGANNGDSEKSASKIAGSTNVVIGGDAKIYADVYGGGWGGFSTAKQGGLIEGGTNITIVENAYISGGIYGGGIAGATEIGGTKTLNIGTADISYNGASTLNVGDFQKINVVNGSAEFASFTQAAEGTLVSIFDKGKLAMSLNSTSQLSNTSFENAGELVFKRGALSDSDTVALKSYTGAGSVSAYGGTFANGVFTAGNSANFESAAITVGTGASDVQSVKLGDKLSLDFNVEGLGEAALTLNEIKASTDLSGIDGDVLAAFDVDLTDNGNDYSVAFSAYVGEIEDIAKLAVWHKGSDGVWTKLDTTIDYVDGVASILVDGFSSYAFTQEVLEPATCAAILGAIALALAAYRRRK